MNTSQKIIEPNQTSSLSLKNVRKPLIHYSFFRSLVFQILISMHFYFLAWSNIRSQNKRIIWIWLLEISLDLIFKLNLVFNFTDPLGISPVKKLLKNLHWLVKANIAVQICTMIYLHSFYSYVMLIGIVLFVFDILNKYELSLGSEKGFNIEKCVDFFVPITFYSFVKDKSQISIIFLIFLCGNLLCTSEMRHILTSQPSQIFGWSVLEKQKGKKQFTWDEATALKLIIVGLSIGLVLQNFLLMFDSLKTQLCFNAFHTLILLGFGCFANLKRKKLIF